MGRLTIKNRIPLSDDLHSRLKNLKEEKGLSIKFVAHQAITEYLDKLEKPSEVVTQ